MSAFVNMPAISGLLLDISVFSLCAKRTVQTLSLKILYLLRIKLNELNILIRCSHLINQNNIFAYERLFRENTLTFL